MRTVVLYQLLSLDGVAEEPGDWFADDGSEMFENLRTVIEPQETVLLGRGTYDYWVDYWPTSDLEPFVPCRYGSGRCWRRSPPSQAFALGPAPSPAIE